MSDERRFSSVRIPTAEDRSVSPSSSETRYRRKCSDSARKPCLIRVNGRKLIAAETMSAVFTALARTAFQFDKKKDKKTHEVIWREELAKGWNKVIKKPKSQLPGPKQSAELCGGCI